jgi:hypothetical protein
LDEMTRFRLSNIEGKLTVAADKVRKSHRAWSDDQRFAVCPPTFEILKPSISSRSDRSQLMKTWRLTLMIEDMKNIPSERKTIP